jgi:hypothetical protein
MTNYCLQHSHHCLVRASLRQSVTQRTSIDDAILVKYNAKHREDSKMQVDELGGHFVVQQAVQICLGTIRVLY